jgi:hypothetical protein
MVPPAKLDRSAVPLARGWTGLAKLGVLDVLGEPRTTMARLYDGYLAGDHPRARLVADLDAAQTHAALIEEEARILRARFDGVPPQRRPHYAPPDRMAKRIRVELEIESAMPG